MGAQVNWTFTGAHDRPWGPQVLIWLLSNRPIFTRHVARSSPSSKWFSSRILSRVEDTGHFIRLQQDDVLFGLHVGLGGHKYLHMAVRMRRLTTNSLRTRGERTLNCFFFLPFLPLLSTLDPDTAITCRVATVKVIKLKLIEREWLLTNPLSSTRSEKPRKLCFSPKRREERGERIVRIKKERLV